MVLGLGLPPHGPTPTDRFDGETLWWRHERLHRRMLRDFAPALAAIEAERDALEARFQAAVDHAFDAGGLDVAIDRCWREAAEAEARWLAAFPAPRPTPANSHRRSWARLNVVAGMPAG
jgi:secernin